MIKAVGTIVEDREGKILVLKRSQSIESKKEPGTLGLPGGLIRPSTTPLESALMKLKSEVGIDTKRSDLEDLSEYLWNDEIQRSKVKFFVFRLKLKGPHPKIIFNDVGHSGYLWDYPQELIKRKDLMMGMYFILPGVYKLLKIIHKS